MKKVLSAIVAIIFGVAVLNAQPGCPSVNAGADRNIPCGQTCADLTAVPFSGGLTTQYAVNSIAYNPPFPYNTGTAIIANTDDRWSSIINLPFTFCFFGNAYTQLVIGSNGIITFNTALANTYCEYVMNGGLPLVGPANYTNCIMGPYHDIDPEVIPGTYIRYEIGGTAPCRYFKIAYNNVPMYSCNSQRATHMTILYETTNAIEVYIQNKPTCSSWNGGAAVEGIVNAAGNLAYNVPGRGAVAPTWTASNDAWRFTPNGAPNYTIAWFEGTTQIGTGQNIQVCPTVGTTYRAEATYVGCTGSTPVVVTDEVFVGIAGLTVSVDSTKNPTCVGSTDGVLIASYNTNSAVLSYGWTPGGANQTTLTGVGAGTYVFAVTDAGGCVRSDTVVLTDPAPVLVTVPDSSINNCNGNGPTNIGALNSSVSGGTSPYGYLWSTTDTTTSISGLTAGVYTLTVTDINGCTGSDPGTVAYTTLSPSFALPQIQNIQCADGNNGSITVGLNNLAVPPVTYQWSTSPNDTTNTITGLVAGTYTVTGTDAVGCSATASYTLINPPALTSTDTITNSYCGLPNGAIDITPSGGTPTYTFQWSSGATTEDVSSLSGDSTYFVTITDAVGCTLVDTFAVGNEAPFTLSGVVTDILCNGANTGAVDITVGGSAVYTFSWSNGPTTEDISGVVAGTYTVTVRDDNGCTDTYTGVVSQPQPVIVTITPQIAPCALASSGSLTANGSGGTGTITYAWTPTASTATVSNLSNGVYTVTATDANGCTGSATYTVDQPTQTLAVSISGTTTLCSGGNTGTLTATATGGDPGYTYDWTPQGNTATISGLGAGVYTVTVSDNRECSATASVTITNLPAIVTNSSVQLFACANPPYGDVTITATGGTGAGYTYSVTGVGNNTTGLFGNVAAGNYSYTVTDTAGCSAQNSFTITVPPADVYSVSTDSTSCYGIAFSDGSITVTPTGNQNGPYSYSLNFAVAQSDSQFLNVASGTYTVVVTNNNGCSDTLQAAVGSPAQLFVSASPDSIVTAPGVSNGIQVTLTNFNNPSIEWTPTDGLSCTDCLDPNASVNQNTVFYVTVTDNNLTGCAATDSVVIIVNGRVEMPDAFSPNGDGKNDRFGPVSFGIITVKNFRVYNRWGQLIHDKTEPWDGKYNGKEQPIDNYVYYISIETADEDNPGAMKVINKSNSFTLIR